MSEVGREVGREAWRHLSEAQLLALVDGALPDDQAAALAEHLDACPRCAAALAGADPLRPLLAAPAPRPAEPAALYAAILAEAARAEGVAPLPPVAAPLHAAAASPAGAEPLGARWPGLVAASALVIAATAGLQATGELEASLQWSLDGLRAMAALSRSLGSALGAPLWLIALELPLLAAAAWSAYRQRSLRPVI